MNKAGLLLFAAIAAFGQTFEVASVRSAEQITPESIASGKLHIGMKIDAGRVDIGYMSLRDLICTAYEVKPFQVTGGPAYLTTERFDILAKLPEGATKEQVPAMLRALLEERFKLKVHKDSSEQQVYSLEVAKGGPRFKEAPPLTPEAAPAAEPTKPDMVVGDQQIRVNRTAQGANVNLSGGRNGTTKMTMGAGGQMHMEMERMTMAELTQTITPMLDRPVVDHTDLKSAYTIALDLSIADLMQAARVAGIGIPGLGGGPVPGVPGPSVTTASDPSGGSIFNSVTQLGLKLDKKKEPVETIVVDAMEKTPTEN